MSKRAIAFIAAAVILAAALLSLAACKKTPMPLNGIIEFYDITVVIPEGYVRDSTQSTKEQWVFEKDGYKQYIIVNRKAASSDVKAEFDGYYEALRALGAEAERGTYYGGDGVLSKYTKDGVYCQEVAFYCSGYVYAFALRGGSDKEFRDLMGDIITPAGE